MSDDQRPASTAPEPINLVDVCRHIIRIVARLESPLYTELHERQTVERQPDDPADPASGEDTVQG